MANDQYEYVIHPAIGVARVGNHPTKFFLAPEKIGGLPIEYDDTLQEFVPVTNFKEQDSSSGQELIKRQGQKFRIYKYDKKRPNDKPEEVQLGGNILSITWTVHLANKKAAWYEFSELKGNLLLGEENSYKKQGVPFRNQQVVDRKKLIIDPGPITISGENQCKPIQPPATAGDDSTNWPEPCDFPRQDNHEGEPQGQVFDKLGDLKTDDKGNLIVLGGHGHCWGLTDLAGYGGGDYWFDDISDGSVTCEIEINDGPNPPTLKAWVIVGPPDFAPEIVNISSWDDTAFDVAVRKLDLVPKLYKDNQFDSNFVPDYNRDILPIINRISRYHWVANVQSMTALSSNIFDFSKPWEEQNQELSQEYFKYFRKPEPPNLDYQESSKPRQVSLFSNQLPDESGETTGIPLMPLNSSSNSIKNINIEKFLALTETQYFLLEQWFNNFDINHSKPTIPKDYNYPLSTQDRASIGNVVGLPQAPGIEVTWTTQNEAIYELFNIGSGEEQFSQLQIKHHKFEPSKGLTPERDECEKDHDGEYKGCEPGDLTKRMAIPWQADFYNCSIQLINYTDPNVNKVLDDDANLVPKRPTYYAYWWPPQAPWNVINGLNVMGSQHAVQIQKNSHDAEMAGLQMNFARGINSYSQMVNQGWASLGFIRNTNVDSDGKLVEHAEKFPYFVETERNYHDFLYTEVSYQEITKNEEDQDGVFVITSLKKTQDIKKKIISRIQAEQKAIADAKSKGLKSFKMAGQTKETPISEEYEASLQQALEKIESFREIKVRRQPREVPRSGRRIRF
ncbi:hypothetical protein BJP34_25210 [Moorena producens PAL-8-15-08-1]|uniref:L-lysine 6-oxidase n=1 Tax=Moorena producens PAL-8-15-08-1 TaxID=1458985 RepID=A0A1D8TXJ9_9CYAN|nr:CTQ-dependent lysine 6-oxidase LodA [Moorena producens]AOX02304.1 hypothetical protein BJP34_25210 [Moorena producens PAL-8-15-08-1]